MKSKKTQKVKQLLKVQRIRSNEFNNNGILKISNIVNNNLKGKVNTLKDLKKLSDRYNSYTLNSSNTKSSTKFIYLIDGISK